MLRLVVSCAATLALSGCALDFDSIGFTGGGGAGGQGTGAPGSGPSSSSTEKGTTATMPGVCDGVDQDCVPAPPTGWLGPGAWGPVADGCGVDQMPILVAGESANAVPCPCDAVDFSCHGGVLDLFGQQLCQAANLVGDNVPFSPPGSCAFLGNYADGLQSAKVLAPPEVATQGSCDQTGAASPTLVNASNLCALSSPASCGTG